MHAKRLVRRGTVARQPSESRGPSVLDELVSEASLSAQRLSTMEPTRGHPLHPEAAPTLGEVDPWIAVYVGIVMAIIERERQGLGERSPAA
jgi:hypothetical protein